MVFCPAQASFNKRVLGWIAPLLDDAGFQVNICRSLAEAGRRSEGVNPVAMLMAASSAQLAEMEPTLESLGVVAPGVRRILIGERSAMSDPRVAELLMRAALYDALSFPDEGSELIDTLRRASRLAAIESHQSAAQAKSVSLYSQMVGSSAAMREVFDTIRKVSASGAPVMITGESGTGKELAARAIHDRSRFAAGNFIAVNCASFPDELIESELFGHVKGAYTGAGSNRAGRVQQAHGGTLFLDEIGEMSPRAQAKLLRFVQEGVYSPLGSDEEIRSTARIIVATNRDLKEEIGQDRFRHDLFFRLAMLTLEMPPLRRRDEDLELLAKFFLDRFGSEEGRPGLRFSKAALLDIHRYPWPGNVRELIGAIRRAVVMSHGQLVRPADLGIDLSTVAEETVIETLAEARAKTEEKVVRCALNHYGNNVRQASKAIGISRVRMYELIKKYSIAT